MMRSFVRFMRSPFFSYAVSIVLLASVVSYISAKKRWFWSNNDEGYQFIVPEDANADWIGPPIGEQIDLKPLKDSTGGSLSAAVKDGLSMLVLVDPQCGATTAAWDEMKSVRHT